ncbi:hypothetical protein FPQ18DRAFT_357488 [Pyronema domesticum]|uniref:Hyaluronan/mRNA-binding protein domain-containing protein n=1 Tax=Pyronema omphalodes (strain CBS 100304) TaxID=1076935 RepID=U4KV54_PYROM|nr:hypothetical protein FPQ18DRAFT_357488 [Pyronema domesticum]CCX05067.1 Similar to hypothetical protein [Tuber melanosporum Mel28]; acc. no. XP_002842181 [Pyronema omphalodes CBS 100304]
MTRTHKNNDIPHNHPEAEPAFAEHRIPKYFGKSGFVDQAPNKVKKNGGGKGNWGSEVAELDDLENFNSFKTRRRSNSMGHIEDIRPSKFETNDEEPVFEEEHEDEVPLKMVSSNESSASK